MQVMVWRYRYVHLSGASSIQFSVNPIACLIDCVSCDLSVFFLGKIVGVHCAHKFAFVNVVLRILLLYWSGRLVAYIKKKHFCLEQ